MSDDQNELRESIGERLLAVERLGAESQKRLQQELHGMFVRELSGRRRVTYGIVAVAAVASAAICGFLALTEPTLPMLARSGLGVGTLFGIAWAAVAIRVCWKGSIDLKVDSRRIAAMVWIFTVLMMVFFLMIGMSTKDRLLGLMMIGNGLAFLIGAAVYWLSHRIEQAELSTREKLLELELQLARLCEQGLKR